MSRRSGSGRSRISFGTHPTTSCPSWLSCCAVPGATHTANRHACMIASRAANNHARPFHVSWGAVLPFLPVWRETSSPCKVILKFRSPQQSERSVRNRVALFPPEDRPPSAGSYRFPQLWASTGATISSRDHLLFAKKDRKSTRLNSSHGYISYAVFCLKKKTIL